MRKGIKKRNKISDTAWLGTRNWSNRTMIRQAALSVSRTDNFENMNVFNSVTSPRVLSYRCILHYFLTMPVDFNFNLTFGLKLQVGSIKTVTVQKRSIFQVEWLTDHSHIDILIRCSVCVLFSCCLQKESKYCKWPNN